VSRTKGLMHGGNHTYHNLPFSFGIIFMLVEINILTLSNKTNKEERTAQVQ
jgi:hypothetical protein